MTRRVRTTHDVMFNEGRGWDWAKMAGQDAKAALSDFTVEYVQLGGDGGAEDQAPAPASSSPAPRTPLASSDSSTSD
jgi:hypothetical protein